MLVEKVKPEEIMYLGSNIFFKSDRLKSIIVKDALDNGEYEDSFGKHHFERSFYRETNPLIGRWDLYPFFNQMWIDLCQGQVYLRKTPRTYCEWKPCRGVYNWESRLKQWIETYGEDTEVVYGTETDSFYEIYDGLNGAYKGEYNFCYDHDEWIVIYHITLNGCQDYGGICIWMNRYDYSIKIFGIGEDDGFVFPETYSYKDYTSLNLYEKNKLLQLVNDIQIKDFENQNIIDKLWKYPIK